MCRCAEVGIFSTQYLQASLHNTTLGCVVVVCVTTAFVAGDAVTKDYCPSEHFNVTCPPNDVILMEHAQYGRMRSGRCVSGHHGVVGCAVDVLAFFDRKCSGKTRCSVYVADPALQKLEPCSKDFTSYLEAKYTCLSGNSQQLRLYFAVYPRSPTE